MTAAHQIPVTVALRKQVALGIALFRLTSQDGTPLPACSPGSHIDVFLPGNITRQYSICNSTTAQSGYEIAVLNDLKGRGGSTAIHELVHEGQCIKISAPRNMFPLSQTARHHVLIGGGIGITPLLSMARDLHQRGQSFELHYCARSPENAAFHQDLQQSPFQQRVKFYFDNDVGGPKLATALVLKACADLNGTHIYICGPTGFIEMVKAETLGCRLLPDQIHIEHFSAQSFDEETDKEFEIRLQRSDRKLTVGATQTVLEALHSAGFDVPISCGQGICGTCMVGVVDGEIDHRDHYFSDDERRDQDKFLPCCSRAKSPHLTLDL